MKRFLVLLIALLFAAGAHAEDLTSNDLNAGKSVTYSFVNADSTGSSVAIKNTCGAVVLSFNGAGSAGATVYAVPTAATTATSGVQLQSFTGTATGVVVYPGLPFLKIQRTAAPSGGNTGQVFMFCSSSASVGGSGTIAGLNSGTGSESTLNALLNWNSIQGMPGGPIFYVSCAAGGDLGVGTALNPGTREAPFLDWAQARAAIITLANKDGATVRFDAGDTCFTVASGDAIDYGTGVPFGDWTPILRLDTTQPGKQTTITENGLGAVLFIHIHDTTAGGTPNLAGGVVIIQDIKFVSFELGVVVVDDGVRAQALRIRCESGTGASQDCMRAAGTSRVSMLSASGTTTDRAFFNPQEGGWITAIGTDRIAMTTPGATANTSLVDVSASSSWTNITFNSPQKLTLIGHQLQIPSSNAATKQIVRHIHASGTAINNETWSQVWMARVILGGSDFGTGACYEARELTGTRMEYRLYQMTFSNCDQYIVTGTNGADTPPVLDGSYREIKYSIFQATSGVTRLIDINNGAATTAGLYNFVDNVVHQQGGAVANFIRFRRSDTTTETTTTMALCRTGLSNEVAPYNTVLASLCGPNTAETSATLPTDDQFAGSGYRCTDTFDSGAPGCPTAADTAGAADGFCDDFTTFECAKISESYFCDPNEECSRAYAATRPSYTVPAWVWSGVWGGASDIESLTLSALDAGAR